MTRTTKSIPSPGVALSRRQFFGSTAFAGILGGFGAAPAAAAQTDGGGEDTILL